MQTLTILGPAEDVIAYATVGLALVGALGIATSLMLTIASFRTVKATKDTARAAADGVITQKNQLEVLQREVESLERQTAVLEKQHRESTEAAFARLEINSEAHPLGLNNLTVKVVGGSTPASDVVAWSRFGSDYYRLEIGLLSPGSSLALTPSRFTGPPDKAHFPDSVIDSESDFIGVTWTAQVGEDRRARWFVQRYGPGAYRESG